MRHIRLGAMIGMMGTAFWLAHGSLLEARSDGGQRGAQREHLENQSPFLPTDWSPPAPRVVEPETPPARPAEPLNVQLRGVIDWGDGPRFSVFDGDQERSYWLIPGEERNGYRITEFSDDLRSVRIARGEEVLGQLVPLADRSDAPVPVITSAETRARVQAEEAEREREQRRESRREAWRRRGGPERAEAAREMREAFRNASPEEQEAMWSRIREAVNREGDSAESSPEGRRGGRGGGSGRTR